VKVFAPLGEEVNDIALISGTISNLRSRSVEGASIPFRILIAQLMVLFPYISLIYYLGNIDLSPPSAVLRIAI